MLEQPVTEMVVRRADQDSFRGIAADRIRQFVGRWRQHTGISDPVSCEVTAVPPQHVGLGVGTQLGMSVAWGLDSLFGRDEVSLAETALSVGRGHRSAVGAYGFRRGGLIIDDGKSDEDTLGQLRERIELPETWCVALVRLAGVAGLSGSAELAAFATLPPVSADLKQRLRRELHDRLVPAARNGDFESFSESVYQYGYSAGECFAANQGGPFLCSAIAEFVSFCRDVGVPGIGQSSWGPTVYCWFPTSEAADVFVHDRLNKLPNFDAEVVVSSVSRRGATRRIEA